MLLSLSFLASLTALVSGTVLTGNTDCTEATYEDIKLPATGSILGTAISGNKNLKYTSFNAYGAIVEGTTPVIGVETRSPTQGILTTLTTQLMKQLPNVVVAAPYNSITPQSFYFGCSLNSQEGAADVATNCKGTVKGYNKANAEVASAPFAFEVPIVPASKEPQVQVVLPSSFTSVPNVYKIVFLLDNYATKVLLIDNVKYCVKK